MLAGCTFTPVPRQTFDLTQSTTFHLRSFNLPDFSKQFFLKVEKVQQAQIFQGVAEAAAGQVTLALFDQLGSRVALIQQTRASLELTQRPMSTFLVPVDEILLAVTLLCSGRDALLKQFPETRKQKGIERGDQVVYFDDDFFVQTEKATNTCPQGTVTTKNYSLTFTSLDSTSTLP